MTQLIPAKRAADLAGELLQLRGRGGSDKSRALAADDVGLKEIRVDTHTSGTYVQVSMRIDVYGAYIFFTYIYIHMYIRK